MRAIRSLKSGNSISYIPEANSEFSCKNISLRHTVNIQNFGAAKFRQFTIFDISAAIYFRRGVDQRALYSATDAVKIFIGVLI